MLRALTILSLSAAVAVPLRADTTEKSYTDARQVLDAGIKAMGGLEALQGVRDVWRVGSGTGYNQGQSLKPAAPLTTRAIQVTSLSDFAGRRSSTETTSVPQGAPTTRGRAVLSGDSGFFYNLVTKAVVPMLPAGVTGGKTTLRRDPAVLLLTTLGRAETLRSLGDAVVGGRRHRAITFADSDGTQIALYFDAESGLLSKLELLADNPVLGDTLTETVLSDYRDVSGVRLPARVVTRVGGELTQDVAYSEIKVNAGGTPDRFEAPKDAQAVGPPPPPAGVAVTKLGEGAYFAGGGSHHSLVVEFKDHVVVVEAPLGEDRSLAVLAKAAELAPGKPVKYVVPTHYHFDHSGGLRTYIAKGITVVTTPGNQGFVEKLAASPHTIRPDLLQRQPRRPVIETFTGKRAFSDGTRTLEVYDIGPNPHVAEAVIAYLPAEKTVFVADLLTIPLEGPYPPASPALVDFADKIKALGLAVETIAPAHGRIGKMEDLRAALAARPAQD